MKIIDLVKIERESLLKVIELLSSQQIHTSETKVNAKTFIELKETSNNKKNKLKHQQDYRIPLRTKFEILPIKECQDEPDTTNEENFMLPSLDHATSKR